MNEKRTILIVDDEEPIRRLLGEMLKMRGYNCVLAASPAEARDCLKRDHFDLILSDVNMPGESGIDFIRHALTEYKDTAVVMVTAMDDPELAETALVNGAYGYIIKPFKYSEIMINVANAFRRRELEIANRTYRQKLEQRVTKGTEELKNSMERLQKTLEGIIHAMAQTLEARDPYTAGHQRRVADLACAIAEEMGFSKDQIEGIRMAGLIHDLGKISVPAEILSKPGKITDYEFGIIKSHPQIGFDILKEIEFPWPIAQMVLQHHEKINGSGYPLGLSNGMILEEARILAVTDVVEAMSSHRPYRPALGTDKALEEISNDKNILYDPDVVEASLGLFRSKRFHFQS